MTFKIQTIYDSLLKDSSFDNIQNCSVLFHENILDIKTENSFNFRFISSLFVDFLNPQEFKFFNDEFFKDVESPNLLFNALLFRLSSEFNSDKTNSEKELLYSLTFSLISKHTKKPNDNVHYSLGFVTAQAINLGLNVTSFSPMQNNLEKKHSEFFEEGFIDGLSNEYPSLLDNKKLFKLFVSKYKKWAKESKELFVTIYQKFIPIVPQKKNFNPINSNVLFLLKNYFTNDSLVSFVDNYINQSFKQQASQNLPDQNLDKSLFQTQQQLKNEQDKNKKLISFLTIMKNSIKDFNDFDFNSQNAQNDFQSTLINLNKYISSLEEYKTENERVKKIRDGVRSIF